MKVIMLKTIKGKEFSFIKGEKYKALDGDEIAGELVGKILVKQPNSPKGKNWWCAFSKSCIGKILSYSKSDMALFNKRLERNMEYIKGIQRGREGVKSIGKAITNII